MQNIPVCVFIKNIVELLINETNQTALSVICQLLNIHKFDLQ